MKSTLVILACMLGICGTAFADEQQPQINYIGFNDFVDSELDAEDIFSTYIDTIEPIMAKHGLTLETYRVTHALSDHIPADAITFGTAPDQESFQAFFADPDFQAVFPDLVSVIQNHVVVFTDAPFAPDGTSAIQPMMLRMHWIREPLESNRASLLALDAPLQGLKDRHGVGQIGEGRGVSANEGLAGEIKEIPAPHVLTLRTFRDAHAYLEAPAVEAAYEKAEEYVKTSSVFWIEPWKK